MRVAILGFGSVWRRRIRQDPSDPKRFLRAAFYNTTGVQVRGVIRTRPEILGHVRFNGIGGFNPNYPNRMIHEVFDCEEPCIWQGQVKVLFRQRLPVPKLPEYYLVVVTHIETGYVVVGCERWKSENSLLISLSEWREQQEAMLLMPAHGWFRSRLGTFVLEPDAKAPWLATLRLGSSS